MSLESGVINIMITIIVVSIGIIIGAYSQQVDIDLTRKKLCKYEIEYCTKDEILKKIKENDKNRKL
jgi:predicted NUDIX family NTP pyrophosphohydrolase